MVLTTDGGAKPTQLKKRSGIIGTALILFSVFCILAMLLGMFIREPTLRCQLIDINCIAEPDEFLTGSEPMAELELVLLHKYLQMLNMTEANKNHLWKLMQSLPVEHSQLEVAQGLGNVEQNAEALVELLNNDTNQNRANKTSYAQRLTAFKRQISLVSEHLQNQELDPTRIADVRKTMRQYLNFESLANISQWPQDLRTPRARLIEAVNVSLATMGPTRSEMLKTLKKSINDLAETRQTPGLEQLSDGQLGFENSALFSEPDQGQNDD